MSEANELQTGTCKYCGQVHTVTVIGDAQEDLDRAATEICNCTEAVRAKRKKRREKVVNEFLDNNFEFEEDMQFIREAIDTVELWDGGIKAVTIEMDDGWKHQIKLNSDLELVITSKKTEKKGLKTLNCQSPLSSL